MKVARTIALMSSVLAVGLAACSGSTGPVAWVSTGARAAFPSPLAVNGATAITIDGTYLYWTSSDGFLYRAPRASGGIDRVALPAAGTHLSAHNDVFVGWTDASGNATIADVVPATGTIAKLDHQDGALLGLVAGQHGYSVAVATPNGTRVQTCLDASCAPPVEIASPFKSLALDLPTKTFYVLTADGLRICTVDGGCPRQPAATPPASARVAALPGTYFLLDASGQASGEGGAPSLGSAAVPGPTKFSVVDGNGHTESPVGTWTNGAQLAQCLLAPGTTTTVLAVACTDIDVDATGRPIYCLAGSSTIQVLP